MWMLETRSVEETRRLGRVLGEVAEGPVVLALVGDLGAGKTALAQGAGRGLGVTDDVVSPTFVLVAEYAGRLPLLHADAYRLDPAEVEGIGLEEQLEAWPGLALVEWADRVAAALPLDHLRVELAIAGERRAVRVWATGPRAGAALARWRDAWLRSEAP